MPFSTYSSSSAKSRHVSPRLPVHAKDYRSPSPSPVRRPPRRVRKLLTALVTTLAAVAIFRVYVHDLTGVPTYEEIKRYERRLPQHDLNLAFPEGRDGRYVRFVPYTGYGWNNELQDIIMVSQIALLANRGYAFQPYIWSTNPFTPVVAQLDLSFRSAQIPLNAFISGPISGNGHWELGAGAQNASVSGTPSPAPPRSISYDWWEVVCPPERRVVVDVLETRKELGIEWGAPVRDIIERWAEKLRSMNDTCVEVSGDRLFTFFDYGEKRLLSAWDILSTSPVLKQFAWSPLVNTILYQNLPLLQSPSPSASHHDVIDTTLEGLLAVHIRRGDFYKHCLDRFKYNSEYNGWNSFPDYPDVFDPPSPTESSDISAAGRLTALSPREDSYARHCYPSLDQIVDRINLVRDEWYQQTGRTLNRVYVMTNAKSGFLDALRRRLTTTMSESRSWQAVVTTKDLSVPRHSVEVVVAADMLIGEKAEVFIGNGFSSLSSNINLIRRSIGQPATSSRFWHSDRVPLVHSTPS